MGLGKWLRFLMRERLILEVVVVFAIVGALWAYFRDHWEHRDLRLSNGE